MGYNSGARASVKFREDLINHIQNILFNEAFANQCKIGDASFSRRRKLNISTLIVLLMHTFSKSIQRELDDFFQRLNQTEFLVRTVTKGALTQARAKLKPEAFIMLDQVTQEDFYKGAAIYRWGKYRVKAVDGSTIVLPNHHSIKEEFGEHKFGPNADSPRSMARISLLYDPLNGITNDAQISGYSTSEKELCHLHIPKMEPGDLIMFDRYYASLDLMWTLYKKKVDFLFRMKDNWWNVIQEFQAEKKKDKIVDLDCKEGLIKVRLIKSTLPNGTVQVFCTSVLDKKFTPEDFGELYENRWGIEEAYKTLKNWIELENFSGKTSLAVRQDFYSKIFMMNLCSAFANPVAERIKKEKSEYQINKVQGLAMMCVLPVPLFLKGHVSGAIKAFDNLISKTIDQIRPNRHFKRKKKPMKVKFSMNYKNL